MQTNDLMDDNRFLWTMSQNLFSLPNIGSLRGSEAVEMARSSCDNVTHLSPWPMLCRFILSKPAQVHYCYALRWGFPGQKPAKYVLGTRIPHGRASAGNT